MTVGFRNQIDIGLSVADRVIVSVAIQPRTRPPIGRLFAGKPAETLLTTLPRLFSLCGVAHQVACLSAIEAARGEQAMPAMRQRRAAAVTFERFAELLRGLVLGRFARDRDTVRVAQDLLQALAPLQAEFARGRARTETLSQIKTGLEALGIGSAAEPVLPGTPLASTMASARRAADDGGWRHMPAEQCFLSAADDRAIVTRLIDTGAAFAQAPEVDGRFPETGVWARHAIGHSVTRADPAVRLLARIAEIAALLRWIEAGETENDVVEAVTSYALGPRRGAAAVECARGRLHHVIELDEQGCIIGFEFLAPTEWNFHPRGPVVKSLIGAALRGATDHDAVDAMVGSFDPCVGYQLAFQEMADA